jgi:hypothetical protein
MLGCAPATNSHATASNNPGMLQSFDFGDHRLDAAIRIKAAAQR